MKNLKDHKVGDSVIIYGRGSDRVVKITRETQTQLTADGIRFVKESGWQVGGGRYSSYYIRPLEEGDEKRISEEQAAREISKKLERTAWRELTLETLRAVNELVDADLQSRARRA